jgi:O-antigen/teichoic acid export membrane protein
VAAPPVDRPAARVLARLRQLAGSSLLQKSGLSVFDQAVVSGASFVTSVILARSCPREELGVYYLALSVVFFIRGIQEQLVSAPYMIYCSRKRGDELAQYAGSSLVHQCTMMALTSAILAGVLLVGGAPAGGNATFWLLVGAAPLMLLREYIRQLSFAHLEMKAVILLDVSVAVLQLAALFGLSMAGRLNVANTLAVLAIACGLPAIAWFYAKHQPLIIKATAAWLSPANYWPARRPT